MAKNVVKHIWNAVSGLFETVYPRTISSNVLHGGTTVEAELNNKLGKTEKASDSEKLDGIDGSKYARKDVANTLTQDLRIQKAYPAIIFNSSNNQGVKVYHNEFDGEIAQGGYALVITGADENTQFGTAGVLQLIVHGEIFAGSTTNSEVKKVWHAGNLTPSNYEPIFTKNTGFNKNKSDAINSDNSDTLATSKAVKDALDEAIAFAASLVDGAPDTLNTLNELAQALGDDPNFATTVANDIASKLSKSGGAMTGVLNLNTHDLFLNGKAIVASDTDGANGDRTGANIDHIWYDDGTNTWHFCADTTYKHAGNANVYAAKFIGALQGNSDTATKLATARTISLAGDVTGSVSFDGSTNASITTVVGNDSHYHDGRYYTESEVDAKLATKANTHSHPYITNNADDTMAGNLIIDRGISSKITVKCDDGGNAELELRGDNQGTGRLFVGQSTTHGGGIEYNGDGTPVTSGSGSDYVTLYRRSGSTNYWTMRNHVNNGWWEFKETPRVGSTKVSLDGHTHDSRYYTESEINTKLSGKSDTSHNHDNDYLGKTEKASDSGKLDGQDSSVYQNAKTHVKKKEGYTDNQLLNEVANIDNVLICPGTYDITSNITLNGNIEMLTGAILNIANGITVTFCGELNAGIYKVFECNTSGQVEFNHAKNRVGYPEWWGAVTNNSAIDCLKPLERCIKALPVTQLQLADYWISNTLKIQTDKRTLKGVDNYFLDADEGKSTRIVVNSGTADVLFLGFNARPSEHYNFLSNIHVSNLELARALPVTPPAVGNEINGACGVRLQYTIYTQFENVRASEHSLGFVLNGNIANRFSKCTAFRSIGGTTTTNDVFFGFLLNGNAEIGLAGGNASTYITDCTSSIGGSYTFTTAIGLFLNYRPVDTFITRFESAGCYTGIEIRGDGSQSGNADVHIINPIIDVFTQSGIYVHDVGGHGVIDITNGYFAPIGGSTTTFCIRINDCSGMISLTNNQTVCWPNDLALGLWIENSSNVSAKSNMHLGAVRPIVLINSHYCSIEDSINSQQQATMQAAVWVNASTGNYIRPILNGVTNAYPIGIQLINAACLNNEINATLVNGNAISGQKIVINGTNVTVTGLLGTNLVSGVLS